MTPLERRLLEQLGIRESITFDPDTIREVAEKMGTKSHELAQAKNALRDAGYLTEEADVYSSGLSVVTITDEGKAALHPPTTPGAKARKPWWKFW